jgi:anti-anti-sigma regulatory factor
MIINTNHPCCLIIPFGGRLDLEALLPLKMLLHERGTRPALILDCTSVKRFDDEAIEDLDLLRRYLQRQGVSKLMLAVKTPMKEAGRSTRLIPATPGILEARLRRLVR